MTKACMKRGQTDGRTNSQGSFTTLPQLQQVRCLSLAAPIHSFSSLFNWHLKPELNVFATRGYKYLTACVSLFAHRRHPHLSLSRLSSNVVSLGERGSPTVSPLISTIGETSPASERLGGSKRLLTGPARSDSEEGEKLKWAMTHLWFGSDCKISRDEMKQRNHISSLCHHTKLGKSNYWCVLFFFFHFSDQ